MGGTQWAGMHGAPDPNAPCMQQTNQVRIVELTLFVSNTTLSDEYDHGSASAM